MTDPSSRSSGAAAASSEAQAARPRAVTDRGVGPAPVAGTPQELAPGVVRLTAPNPGRMTGPGTNTYLLGGRELAVLDPGPDDPAHLEAIVETARSLGTVRWVVVTHTHPDHAPGARDLALRAGAEVIGHGERDGFVPDRAVGDGYVLDGGDFALRAVHTPGHASNHLCWLLEERGWLFSGDHVMHGATVVIRPPDGDMVDYLASLRRVVALEPPVSRIAPGHGRLLEDPAGVVSDIVGHRLDRESRVLSALGPLPGSPIDQLVPAVYADVDPRMHDVARLSLWAHLRKLVAEGKAVEVVPSDTDGDGGFWALAG